MRQLPDIWIFQQPCFTVTIAGYKEGHDYIGDFIKKRVDWCIANCKGRHKGHWYFELEEDAIAYAKVWGGDVMPYDAQSNGA